MSSVDGVGSRMAVVTPVRLHSRITRTLLVPLAFLSTSCGTRVHTTSAPTRQTQDVGTPGTHAHSSGISDTPSLAPVNDESPIRPGAASGSASGLTGAPVPAVERASGSGDVSTPGASDPHRPPSGLSPQGSSSGETQAPSPPKDTGGKPADALPVAPTKRSAAVFAVVGTFSGPVGTVFLPTRRGVELWTAYINQRGGLNGHQVKLLTYDDGGDPARHRAVVQEAIERQKVIGFLIPADSLTASKSTSDYITAQRVPVIGEDGSHDFAYSSPMYFPHVSAGHSLYHTWMPSVAEQVVPNGKSKLGTLICVEASSCDEANSVIAEDAKAAGFDHVYRGRASLAQPDYTAECLAARNAGVNVFFAILDQNSMSRLGAACARQAYRPTFAMVGQATAEAMKEDPNLVGAVSSSSVFPYFQLGTAATDEFHAAVRGYGATPSVGLSFGWAAGKLLERAGMNLSEPPTKELVLDGLWSLKDDTLDGLTAPLTFVREQPPKPFSCWFDLAIVDKKWTSPDGYRLHCRDR